ncbi:MAG: hypothetical protein PF447_00315, partial [Spirochaetaceae bacterium]|nr:hypothetical protein [Spirochaetaceae bacterium]
MNEQSWDKRQRLLKQYKRRFLLILGKRFMGFLVHPIKTLAYLRDKRLLLSSGLFDGSYYLQQNPDLFD